MPHPNDLLILSDGRRATRAALAAEVGLADTASDSELEAALKAKATPERTLTVPLTDAEGRSLAQTTQGGRTMSLTTEQIDQEIAAAASDGRIADRPDRRAYWRLQLQARGEPARDVLRSLAPVAAEIAELAASAGSTSRRVPGTQHVAMPAVSEGLTRNDTGEFSYKGMPAFMGEDGHPRVVTSSGPMRTEVFDATIPADQIEVERVSVELTASLGLGDQIGMPRRSLLLGGSSASAAPAAPAADVQAASSADAPDLASTGWFPSLREGE